jgi:hypothetical protein
MQLRRFVTTLYLDLPGNGTNQLHADKATVGCMQAVNNSRTEEICDAVYSTRVGKQWRAPAAVMSSNNFQVDVRIIIRLCSVNYQRYTFL